MLRYLYKAKKMMTMMGRMEINQNAKPCVASKTRLHGWLPAGV